MCAGIRELSLKPLQKERYDYLHFTARILRSERSGHGVKDPLPVNMAEQEFTTRSSWLPALHHSAPGPPPVASVIDFRIRTQFGMRVQGLCHVEDLAERSHTWSPELWESHKFSRPFCGVSKLFSTTSWSLVDLCTMNLSTPVILGSSLSVLSSLSLQGRSQSWQNGTTFGLHD